MRFRTASYRNGLQILRASGAHAEVTAVLTSIRTDDVEERRRQRQERYAADGRQRKAGIQDGLNAILHEELTRRKWNPEVPVFKADNDTKKGFWTMDFVKPFAEGITVGMEVTFNHAEAIPWTLIRPTLAHESESVLPDARIHVGVIVMGTDHLKGNRETGLRMDGAVGTYERLRTLLPKMRAVLPAPLVIFGLDWADGGEAEGPEAIELHTSSSGVGNLKRKRLLP